MCLSMCVCACACACVCDHRCSQSTKMLLDFLLSICQRSLLNKQLQQQLTTLTLAPNTKQRKCRNAVASQRCSSGILELLSRDTSPTALPSSASTLKAAAAASFTTGARQALSLPAAAATKAFTLTSSLHCKQTDRSRQRCEATRA